MTSNVKYFALATDDNYAKACAVCITSILENNSCCHVYVLTLSLREENKRIFHRLSEFYKQAIEIVVVCEKLLPRVQASIRYPKAIYLRLLLPQLLKHDKVLYLDCDIIVRKDLTEFYNTDLSGMSCAAVEDNVSDDILNKNRLKTDCSLYNSGVLLLNLDFWRLNNISAKLIDFMVEKYGELLYPDQDAMNLLLSDTIIKSSYTYNMQHCFFEEKKYLLVHWTKWKEIDACKEDPAIIHYTHSIKPWFKECKHPLKDCFWSYAKKNACFQMIAEHYYPFFYRIIMKITGIIQRKAYQFIRKDLVK